MKETFVRTAMLLGEEALECLAGKHVAVFGIGGVGGYVAEALVRSGVGILTLVDNDTVSESNINRQIVATTKTIGRYKTEVMKERALEIRPDMVIKEHRCFFLPEIADEFDFTEYDYVVDAVDTVTAKIALIEAAKKADVPVISCMGTGNKLHPDMFEITDISKTSVCPLAKVMRKELKTRGIAGVKVLYSKEEAKKSLVDITSQDGRRATPGSVAFVPSVAGLMIAGKLIEELIGGYKE